MSVQDNIEKAGIPVNEYLHFLGTTFPNWMSHFPGGLNYDHRQPLREARTTAFIECGKLLQEADRLGITHFGGYRAQPEQFTPLDLLVKYSTGTRMRKIRARWKSLCRACGVSSENEIWRHQKTPDDLYIKEWELFNASALELQRKLTN